jgi:translation elongation factor EF-Ts
MISMSEKYEPADYILDALRRKAGVPLTNSDCRVALRETKGSLESAFQWLLENKIIARTAPEEKVHTAMSAMAGLKSLSPLGFQH